MKKLDTSKASPMPNSMGEALDRAGIKDRGYLEKNGMSGKWSCDADGIRGQILNKLPPGMGIEDQDASLAGESAKRLSKIKLVDEIGYEGDGWTSKP